MVMWEAAAPSSNRAVGLLWRWVAVVMTYVSGRQTERGVGLFFFGRRGIPIMEKVEGGKGKGVVRIVCLHAEPMCVC